MFFLVPPSLLYMGSFDLDCNEYFASAESGLNDTSTCNAVVVYGLDYVPESIAGYECKCTKGGFN